MPEQLRAIIGQIDSFWKIEQTGSALLTYTRTLSKHPMTSLDLAIVQDITALLIRNGDIDAAESIFHDSSNYTLAENVNKTVAEFQMMLLKQINFAKRLKPTLDALSQVILLEPGPDRFRKPSSLITDVTRSISVT